MELEQKWITLAKAYAEEKCQHDTSGHDISHSLRVYRNAQMIMRQEAVNVDELAVALASLLHDTVDAKLFDEKYALHQLQTFLKDCQIPAATCDRVLEIVQTISFHKHIDPSALSIESQIVQDADRLDAIGAIGIARAFAYGATVGHPMYDKNSFSASVSTATHISNHTTIQHFYDKLLQLKDKMNTSTARQMALQRHELLLIFLKQFQIEI
ncbi:HD domain-containing protein [Allofustis seminis]|uniref:HD domain-containing protein n=1 Tax=Allofustis seminis TaxID=166939 RepID=UPI000373DB15|nr:HD domain-containing protein [Allofustis seminis]